MSINDNLLDKINEFPSDIRYLAKELLNGIEKDKTTTQLEEILMNEIAELIEEE